MLEEVWADCNRIESVEGFSQLAKVKKLHSVFLKMNPIFKGTNAINFNAIVTNILPSVKEIDSGLL